MNRVGVAQLSLAHTVGTNLWHRQEPLKLGKRVVPSWWGANFTVLWGFTYNLLKTEIPTDPRKLLQKMIISTRTFLRSICTTR